jgi:hypothetical protein
MRLLPHVPVTPPPVGPHDDDLLSIVKFSMRLLPHVPQEEEEEDPEEPEVKSNDLLSIVKFSMKLLTYLPKEEEYDGICADEAKQAMKENKNNRLIGLIDGQCHFIDISNNTISSVPYTQPKPRSRSTNKKNKGGRRRSTKKKTKQNRRK